MMNSTLMLKYEISSEWKNTVARVLSVGAYGDATYRHCLKELSSYKIEEKI